MIGCFLCAREAIRRMSTRHGGHGGGIVNVSSTAARLGNANMWVHYAASKAALDTFTFGLAREVGPDGIRVNAVAPELIDTEIHGPQAAANAIRRSCRTRRSAGSARQTTWPRRSCGCCRMPRASSPAPWSR